MRNLILALVLLFGYNTQAQQSSLPRSYTALYTNTPPVIDGVVAKKEWKNAAWSELYTDISDSTKPKPPMDTRCKMMWDDDFLYVAAVLEETDLWATLKDHDAIIYRDNDFEVFINPNNDAQQYFEIEINALGTVMDLFMPKPYKKGGKPGMNWNATGMKSAVFLKGTLNNNSDKDKFWSVEMAIPFECMKREGRIHRPADGSTWRINFSRVQWILDKSGSSYEPRKQPNGKRLPEYNWVWSPQGIIDMHVPEKWGYLHFKKTASR